MKKILCVGPQWRGSNAGGLFRAFARTGNLISIVDENYHLNLSDKNLKTKVINKIFRKWNIIEFNNAIIKESEIFNPDIILVYKGAFVLPETLKYLKNKNHKLFNFYPDVSFHTHGSLLGATLGLYDHIFTTKTFGIKDMKEQLGITSSSFIPHGFDPDIHRAIDISKYEKNYFKCDVSFIGGWSEKKESLLLSIKQNIPDIDIKIWGPRWEQNKSKELKSSIQHKGIFGDLYTLGILSSNINLGLLHEKVTGASSGDLITSRTFHIPGAGGFMLHERTCEINNYFEEGKEIECFSDEAELIEKVSYYLSNKEKREDIARAGYTRSMNDHSLDQRAKKVLDIISII